MPIKNRFAEMLPEIAAWRQDIHENPELQFDVHRTAGKVADLCRSFGCDEVTEGIGKTGVVDREDAGIAILKLAVLGDQGGRKSVCLPAQRPTDSCQIVIVDLVGPTRIEVFRVAIVFQSAHGDAGLLAHEIADLVPDVMHAMRSA